MRKILAIAFSLSLIASAAAAQTCGSLPDNLTNGTVADATQVMANFTALLNCVNNVGLVSSGTAGQVGYYNATGNTISGESLSALIDSTFGSTQGSILYRGASGWALLAPGTSGFFLETQGSGANPQWATGSGGSGTVTSVATGTGLTGGPITTTGTVSLASIANQTILANYSGSSAAPAATSLNNILNAGLCLSTGALAYNGPGGTWGCITHGTVGQFLEQEQPGGNPTPVWSSLPHHQARYIWCASCTVAADTLPIMVPQDAGTITSVTYLTGGSGTPSFTLSVKIAGTNVTACNGLTVSSSTATTTTCTGANTFTSGQLVTVAVGSISGTPNDALVQINYTVP